MKAVVFHDVGDIRLEEVSQPRIREPHDAIVRITTSAICGTDLHMIRGTMSGMESGTILGHEGVGVIEELGKNVRNHQKGDRVVIPSTIACGYCSYCRSGYYSQCDNANPNGPLAGTAFFGGPKTTGPFDGLQAEFARVPFAHVGLVKIPDEVTDDQAILLSDIFPTGYFGAELAEVTTGDTVAVFGCGPVGMFAIMSCFMKGAGRVLAIDHEPSRLERARALGAEVINFDEEDPVKMIQVLTGSIGVDRAIDAVGVDAQRPEQGPAGQKAEMMKDEFSRELKKTAPSAHVEGEEWIAGNAPSQALRWEIMGLAKAGTLGVIGVYPETFSTMPFGSAMMKNLTIKSGNCPHRKYIPMLMEQVQSGALHPEKVITKSEAFTSVLDAYHAFDERQSGWLKVALRTAA
jgi:threonine dehydrogenase-like Zn-dependent dehydrogenase